MGWRCRACLGQRESSGPTQYLRLVGLERYADLYPKELSGGMKKRCQIATVLANNPDVLLMDEPFGALDYPTKCQLQEELLRILGREPKTTRIRHARYRRGVVPC